MKTKTKKPEPVSIRPALGELEKLFNLFAPLFPEPLTAPIITIQTRGRKNALGWYKPQTWQNGGRDTLPELNISAESLARGVPEIADTVLHEMVHHWNRLHGIKDCSGNQYHSKKFKAGCDLVGLKCEKMEGHGWAATSLSDKQRAIVKKAGIKDEAFHLFRLADHGGKGPGSRMKKWTCPCGTIIRAAGEISVRCNECGEDFERDED